MSHATRRDIVIGCGASVVAAMAPAERARAAPAQQTASMPDREWDFCTAKELVAALRARKISALELTERMIARIEALDRRINAVVVRDFDRARDAARRADVALDRGETRALLGVPVTVKESFNIAGLPTSWGFPRYARFTPRQDALVVARAKSAGAIILGKTNVPVALSDWQTHNEIYGATNNPWDLRRTPGGSSGGSAAALAAGFGPLSLGSDLGGSLRAPAHYCGVYAHRPTPGLIPRRGHVPPGVPPLPRDSDLAVIGPMARCASDLGLALDVLAGPDEERAGVGYKLALPEARHRELGRFRVLVIDTHPLTPTASVVRAALARLSQRLAGAGVTLAHASPLLPDLAESARVYMRLLYSLWGGELPPRTYAQLRRTAAALSPRDRSLAAERMRGAVIDHRDWLAADEARLRLQRQWSEVFREWDIVLCPAAPTPAFPHDRSTPIASRRLDIDGKSWSYLDAQLAWAELATTPGLPATVAPIDHAPSGLPIGAQILGPYLEDRTTIAFAELLEREFGGFTPPPGYV
ncbi:amidase [Methylosinus sp. Sm6]|uniref:amidase n=1 Tax=Methylosinus sp. Sm6 TaxID=2866948 RepID=UPI001C99A727|nr:amidase [Methylosinus sp. Sm6]MBY6240518.1 amidase [Methylosinus sp. Sm6]